MYKYDRVITTCNVIQLVIQVNPVYVWMQGTHDHKAWDIVTNYIFRTYPNKYHQRKGIENQGRPSLVVFYIHTGEVIIRNT